MQNIRNIIQALSENFSIKQIRAEQGGPKPVYPYLVWKHTASDSEAHHNAVHETNNVDAENIAVRTERNVSAIVSLTFIHEQKRMDQLWKLVEKSVVWLDSPEGGVCAEQFGIVIAIHSQPGDRSAMLETHYEARIGFDINLTGVILATRTETKMDLRQIQTEMIQ